MSKVLFIRFDAGPETGFGHGMRMLALAEAWTARRHPVHFAASCCPEFLRLRFEESGSIFHQLRSNESGESAELDQIEAIANEIEPLWIVLDGYNFNHDYQKRISSLARSVILDDVEFAKSFEVDLLLNQNPYASRRSYRALSSDVRLLCGADFLLLRHEFSSITPQRFRKDKRPKILLTFGGSDSGARILSDTIECLSARAGKDFDVTVISGGKDKFAGANEVNTENLKGFSFRETSTSMAELIADHDIVIGGAGTTTYEWLYLGKRGVVFCLAENQRFVFDWVQTVSPNESLALESVSELEPAVQQLIGRLSDEVENRVFDDAGNDRFAAALLHGIWFREAREEDVDLLYEWANDPEVRKASFRTESISYEEHTAWFRERLSDSSSIIDLYYDLEGAAVGQVRLQEEPGGLRVNYSVNSSQRGKGIATRMLDDVVSRYNDHPMLASVKDTNVASIRVLEKAGFSQEDEFRRLDIVAASN